MHQTSSLPYKSNLLTTFLQILKSEDMDLNEGWLSDYCIVKLFFFAKLFVNTLMVIVCKSSMHTNVWCMPYTGDDLQGEVNLKEEHLKKFVYIIGIVLNRVHKTRNSN